MSLQVKPLEVKIMKLKMNLNSYKTNNILIKEKVKNKSVSFFNILIFLMSIMDHILGKEITTTNISLGEKYWETIHY